MKFLNLSLAALMFRFYIMMAIVIIAGFTGLWFLSILALPVFFSALLGIQFKKHQSIRKPGIKSAAIQANPHQPAH